MEYEVKVRDICGDAGLEELLATYTKCSDGAEHIYCMRIKLKKAPGWDWMCKECMAKEETQKEIKGVIECPISDKDIRRFDANLRLFPRFIDNDL